MAMLSFGWVMLLAARPVGFFVRKTFGVRAYVIQVDLNSPKVRVTVGLARGFPHGTESFASMIHRYFPTAAVNGTYFCKSTLRPIGDIVVGGRPKLVGGLGVALALTLDRTAFLLRVPRWRKISWQGYITAIGGGPTLVRSGRIWLNPVKEGFRDRRVLGYARRTAVGIRSDVNKLVLVCTKSAISLKHMARVMLSLGCSDAMCLDGGASTGMFYRGRMIIRPKRRLTNALLVYEYKGPPPSRGLASRGVEYRLIVLPTGEPF